MIHLDDTRDQLSFMFERAWHSEFSFLVIVSKWIVIVHIPVQYVPRPLSALFCRACESVPLPPCPRKRIDRRRDVSVHHQPVTLLQFVVAWHLDPRWLPALITPAVRRSTEQNSIKTVLTERYKDFKVLKNNTCNKIQTHPTASTSTTNHWT